MIKETRHPHPHVDPRFPRDGGRPGTNPPHFAWKPEQGEGAFRLQVSNNADFHPRHHVIDVTTDDPVYLPDEALESGEYFWRWGSADAWSEPLAFSMADTAVVLEVPLVEEWLQRISKAHPRIYVSAEEAGEFRDRLARERTEDLREVLQEADAILAEAHELAEPEFLPDRNSDYHAFWRIWYPTMWGTRRFVKGAEALALAYLSSGERKYARAACERMTSISTWDPEGSSYLGHNDEAHMSVIWHGAIVCDWVWDEFSEDERGLVIEQFRRRGQITFDHMHDQGHYGITRFDSHAGREIVFLAILAFVFHDHVREARGWLEWLRPVLCGMWPSWADDDGSWAQGISYGVAYVTIMTMFVSALKRSTGVDLYRRPFWKNHARWRYFCFPPYVEWMGFGDNSEKWAPSWNNNADLVDLIARETGAGEYLPYVRAFREEARSLSTPEERHMPGVVSQLFTAPPSDEAGSKVEGEQRALNVFPDAGWAAFRSDTADRDRDVALIFRSSPYGAVSHSHANNNDFIIHVGGRVMAMPSGYYVGYGSGHHAHWVWHTKSHNCVTLSDASQLMRSPDSAGKTVNAFEDDRIAYVCGVADASYQDRAQRCRRHIVFLKSTSCFVMVDEFVGRPEIVSSLQWNIHSWNRFEVDEDGNRFTLQRDTSTLTGTFLCQSNSFFTLSEGWDPPPMASKDGSEWRQQYHLRFTPVELEPARNLGVVLAPSHPHLEEAVVRTSMEEGVEMASIGDDAVSVQPPNSDPVATLEVSGVHYRIGDGGILSV